MVLRRSAAPSFRSRDTAARLKSLEHAFCVSFPVIIYVIASFLSPGIACNCNFELISDVLIVKVLHDN